MAKYSSKHHNHVLFHLAIVAFFAVVGVIGLNVVNSPNSILGRSRAAVIGPLTINPCSGGWNTTDCFTIKNNNSTPLKLNYLLDCWDETKCKDESGSITLAAKETKQFKYGRPCSKWQLDLDWTGDGKWDWGGIVEAGANCGTPVPTADPMCKNFVEIKVP